MLMKIKVLFFGITSDLMQTTELQITLKDGQTVADFRKQLQIDYPQLEHLNTYAIALNEEYTIGDEVIQQNDILAVIPPVSGG